ncbi:MAG: DUF1150 domain-containing protein [Holosporales bacterium]|jgi:hypothetical protein|nr:DUF1150 domain-containing protein [Holosporales bacterium]
MLTENQDWLRKISEREFATLGVSVVAYIKPVQGDKFSIYAADGSNLGSSNSKDSAVQAVCLSDLIPVSVH